MRLKTPLDPVLVFGEVLYDTFPDRKYLGGAPFNYAYHLHHMGIPTRLISKVGGDKPGQDILERLQKIGFPIDGVQLDIIHLTGEVEVNLDAPGGPEYNILPDRAYDYIDYDPYIESLISQEISLVYFGTLAQRHSASAETLKKIFQVLASRSTFMMDINLRYPYFTSEVLQSSLQQCDILKINSAEVAAIKESLNLTVSLSDLPRYIIDTYQVGFVCVTKGEEGSDLYEAGSRLSFHCPGLPPEKIVDTVGSGDAFSAMMTACYLAGFPRQSQIEKATEFASRICEIPGPLPEDLEFYKPFRFA